MLQAAFAASILLFSLMPAVAKVAAQATYERMAEWTLESQKSYSDPFNDVEVDVVFSKGNEQWRVPAFWRGERKWTVRFAPPQPGEYAYRLESTDRSNPDLNGHAGRVMITGYAGPNELLKRGALRVGDNKRYFEHADGTPFFWLADTWWTGLSDRLPWEGFKHLTADRKAKGFTVVQIVGGLVPSNGEEIPPLDPGYCNEGGCVWDRNFTQINPRYFDAADRRIQHLVDSGIVPAIVGAWFDVAPLMGAEKLEQHWRYLIARYGAYPVFWIVGGEVFQPQANDTRNASRAVTGDIWSEVTQYVRNTDPYRHPLTVHEFPPPLHGGLVDESLTDFDLPQPAHWGWSSLATEVAQLTSLYARTDVTRPIVQGEIGYEQLGAEHDASFQRAAFWLAMLNGAVGHTYGAIGTWESYSADKPMHRKKWSFLTWEEGMNLPGSTQVSLNAKLLKQYPWHRFAPHPEWVSPRGTTLFDPHDAAHPPELDLMSAHIAALENSTSTLEDAIPAGEWQRRKGTFRQPYAAGIPGAVRFIYIPYFGAVASGPPTVHGLEPEVRYRAYYWDPMLGIKVDLGSVQRPAPGKLIFADSTRSRKATSWVNSSNPRSSDDAGEAESEVSLLTDVRRKDLVATLTLSAAADAAVVLRYQDSSNYVAARYSSADRVIYLQVRADGKDEAPLGKTDVSTLGGDLRLTTELRDRYGIVSISDGQHTTASPVISFGGLFDRTVSTAANSAGGVGVMRLKGQALSFGDFEVRESPTISTDANLNRKLYDARGVYRGEMSGTPEWESYGRTKLILLDAYRPERFPSRQDWVLVLSRDEAALPRSRGH